MSNRMKLYSKFIAEQQARTTGALRAEPLQEQVKVPLRVTTNEGEETHEIMDTEHPKGTRSWGEPGEHGDIEAKMVDYIHKQAKIPVARDDVDEYMSNFSDHFRVLDKDEFHQFEPTHTHKTMADFLKKKGNQEAKQLRQEHKDGVFDYE